MKVLFVVDVQNDFCPGGALAVPEGDSIVWKINRMMHHAGFDLVLASKDMHPADHSSFEIWPEHCVAGTPGCDFHPELDKYQIDKVFEKGTDRDVDSYSAFFDAEGNNNTKLLDYLMEQAIERGETLSDIEFVVCGLATDYCVKETALHAAKVGLNTTVVIDAARAVNVNEGDELKAIKEMAAAGIEMIESRTLDPEYFKAVYVTPPADRGQELQP